MIITSYGTKDLPHNFLNLRNLSQSTCEIKVAHNIYYYHIKSMTSLKRY